MFKMCLKSSREEIKKEENEQEKNMEIKFNEFIEQFNNELESNSRYEIDTPILRKLFDEYIQNIYQTSATYKTILKQKEQIKAELEIELTDNQKILLEKIKYCNIEMNADMTLQAFIYRLCYVLTNER